MQYQAVNCIHFKFFPLINSILTVKPKYMKKISIAALLCMAVYTQTFAQKIIEKTLPFSKNQKIDLDLKFGDLIQVHAWDKNEVYIKATIDINNGKLDDALLMDFKSSTSEIKVTVDFDKELIKQGRPEDCPDNNNSYSHNGRDSYVVCSEINYQVYLPKGADLTMETISANIELKDIAGPVFAKSISGFVDMNWPANKGISVAMKSITGELYSDLDIDYSNKKDKPDYVGYLLKGTLNGGGPEVYLESISNDIYLRKAK